MIRFQHPEYLWLLGAIPLLVLLFASFLRWRKHIFKKIGDIKLVNSQLLGLIPGRILLKAFLVLTALTIAIIGTANLQGGGKPEKIQRKGVDVMIALDVSKSMLAHDLQPDRLSRAKQLIESLLDKLQNDRVGLVIFAGRAYLQVPLTVDFSALRMMLQNARPQQVPTQGTVIGEAIELSMQSFSQKEKKFKSLIIISDGEDHDENAMAKAKDAAESGIVIHTVGVGSPQGAPIFDENTKSQKLDENGDPVITKLNEEELQRIASAGQGTYSRLLNSAQIAGNLANSISGMEGRSLGMVSYVDYKSYFQYFLLPAILLLILESFIPGATKPDKWDAA